ncbi:hypothetical protein [Nocardia sp. CC227C]|uniref:hypothetical protein n=1 Tax=Nocardia sp. CC227C TaxID=3044562 RepID=UPI00278C3A75|nr:hypothetical protein [Nocardia sp. CC227C]
MGEIAEIVPQSGFRNAEIDVATFGYFDDPNDVYCRLYVGSEASLDYMVSKFMDYVHGPAARWFDDRGSLDKPFSLATQGNPMRVDTLNPDPTRLRGVATLGVANDRPEAVADLMQWYLSRSEFHHWDSFERVSAFDAVLASRYPSYARVRGI